MSVTRGKFRTAIGAAEGRSQLMAGRPDRKIMGSKSGVGWESDCNQRRRARGGPDRIGNLMFPSMWRHYAHGHAYQTGDQIVDEFYRARLKGGSQVE